MSLKNKKEKITKKQGIAYAKVALHFLEVMHIELNPKNLEEQMILVYDLYEPFEIVRQGRKY